MKLEILHTQTPIQIVSWLRSWLAGCICSTQPPPETPFPREQFTKLVFQLPFTTFQFQLSRWFQAQRLAQVEAIDEALLALVTLKESNACLLWLLFYPNFSKPSLQLHLLVCFCIVSFFPAIAIFILFLVTAMSSVFFPLNIWSVLVFRTKEAVRSVWGWGGGKPSLNIQPSHLHRISPLLFKLQCQPINL